MSLQSRNRGGKNQIARSCREYLLARACEKEIAGEKERYRSMLVAPLYLVLILAFAIPVRYARTGRLNGKKDDEEGLTAGGEDGVKKEKKRWKHGRRRSERKRDRLSCQAAVNLHARDVEAGDFFCTSPLICASDYLNWLEQS